MNDPGPGIHVAVAADGAELEYEVAGDGDETVVLLHGSFTGRRAFSRQRAALLEAGFRLVLPSMRGHDGSSPTLPPEHGFDTTELADLLMVLGADGHRRVHLVGHSTGGTVAFALARDRPERVGRMVLIEPTLVGLLPDPWRAESLAAMGRAVNAGQAEAGRPAMRATMDFIGGDLWHGLPPEGQEAQLNALSPVAHLAAPHLGGLARFPVAPADVFSLVPPTLFLYGRDSVAILSTGDGASDADVEADGRYLTFESAANNLVPGDTNGFSDVFVHDRQTWQTKRVSVAYNGAQATVGSNSSSAMIGFAWRKQSTPTGMPQ